LTYLERQKSYGPDKLRWEEVEAEEKIRLKQYVSLRSKGRHNNTSVGLQHCPCAITLNSEVLCSEINNQSERYNIYNFIFLLKNAYSVLIYIARQMLDIQVIINKLNG